MNVGMNLTDFQKGWLTRLFALGGFVFLVYCGITFINPLVIGLLYTICELIVFLAVSN